MPCVVPHLLTSTHACIPTLRQFTERKDLVAYHPDVKTYEVRETAADGQDRLVGLFLHDNFLRQHKKSGAWMSDYRSQSRTASADGSSVTPVIVNNNNFAKGDSVTLLSFDDATTYVARV